MLNEENIKNFSKLSDQEIKDRITSAAQAGNISPERLKSILADTDKIRTVISKLSPNDIQRLVKKKIIKKCRQRNKWRVIVAE